MKIAAARLLQSFLIASSVQMHAYAAQAIPFTPNEVLNLLNIKAWKFEHLFREPSKGAKIAIILGTVDPQGNVSETELKTNYGGLRTAQQKTRFEISFAILEEPKEFSFAIDGVGLSIPIPSTFKYDYSTRMAGGMNDGYLVILAYNSKDRLKPVRSKSDLASYLALRVTPVQ